MRKIISTTLVILLTCGLSAYRPIANMQGNSTLAKHVHDKNFVFTPQQAIPSDGSYNQIPVYDSQLRIVVDSVVSTLPYYGLVHKATNNSNDVHLRFESTKFDYDVKVRKKGGWDVTIRPWDVKGVVQQLYLTIFPDGGTQLQVISATRQSIMFVGLSK